MKRREFIAALGGAAAWPVRAWAQQRRSPVIGLVHSGSRVGNLRLMTAFYDGLNSEGFVEGRNVTIEYRWANDVLASLPNLMNEVIQLQPDVIAAMAWAARTASDARSAGEAGSIPIVVSIGSDPATLGLKGLNRPENNLTGATSLAGVLAGKRVEFLRQVLSTRARIALLENPTTPGLLRANERSDIETAVQSMGWQLHVEHASSKADLDTAFAGIVRAKVAGLIIGTDSFFYSEARRLGELAAHHSLPAVGPLRDFPAAGGLMSYSTSIPSTYRQAGVYVGKILKGTRPADLPFKIGYQPQGRKDAGHYNPTRSTSRRR